MYDQKILNIKDKPHSYEFGKANNRHKIYYNGVKELIDHIKFLKDAGLIDDELEIKALEKAERTFKDY